MVKAVFLSQDCYIETNTTSLLVDVGISCKRLVVKLDELKI